MLLIGETIGHIVIERCLDAETNKIFNIRYNVFEIVP